MPTLAMPKLEKRIVADPRDGDRRRIVSRGGKKQRERQGACRPRRRPRRDAGNRRPDGRCPRLPRPPTAWPAQARLPARPAASATTAILSQTDLARRADSRTAQTLPASRHGEHKAREPVAAKARVAAAPCRATPSENTSARPTPLMDCATTTSHAAPETHSQRQTRSRRSMRARRPTMAAKRGCDRRRPKRRRGDEDR